MASSHADASGLPVRLERGRPVHESSTPRGRPSQETSAMASGWVTAAARRCTEAARDGRRAREGQLEVLRAQQDAAVRLAPSGGGETQPGRPQLYPRRCSREDRSSARPPPRSARHDSRCRPRPPSRPSTARSEPPEICTSRAPGPRALGIALRAAPTWQSVHCVRRCDCAPRTPWDS